MRKAVFFDLDGTLLPLDMEGFIREYFVQIEKSRFFELLGPRGREAFDTALHALFRNDGRALNRDVFFETLYTLADADHQAVITHMDRFYENEFHAVRPHTRAEPAAVQTVRVLKQKGYRLILATNPIFPPIATNTRLHWAGLDIADFEYVSYYDNSHYCKPNHKYFTEILKATGLFADECYFVGNDVDEDMACVALGFKGFLVLDHLIGNARRAPQCVQGNYSDLLSFAESLPRV